MSSNREVTAHYSRGDLLSRLNAFLEEDGVDPEHPSIEALAPYDQFHSRGLEATVEVAELVQAQPGDHLLDIGSGIGGPARWFARHFGCRVTGIDLTAPYCEVARHLTRRLGLEGRVSFEVGSALQMPFGEASFDGAYSMNVSMNIADRDGLYREVHRVLKPGAWLLLSEIARGEGPELEYPTPWATTAATSFLATPQETESGLLAAGFEVIRWRDSVEESIAYAARSRAMVARGEKPLQRAATLMHGEKAALMGVNGTRGIAEGRIVPIEILARRR